MSVASSSKPGPFPGPRPYDWSLRDYFCGRNRETVDIVNRVLRERFVVLTGPSGTGKTSLLSAGVFRTLNDLRQAQKKEAPDHARVGPVLLMRHWGDVRGDVRAEDRPTSEVLAIQLHKAGQEGSDSLSSRDSADGAVFARVPYIESFTDYLKRLCDEFGDLILVFDQFEELLRLKARIRADVVDYLSRLYQNEPKVRILVSLREEYHRELRPLEYHLGGLYGRTYWLTPLSIEAAQNAVLEAGRKAGLPERTLQVLLDWHETWQMQYNPQLETTPGEQDADLLTLQTILREYLEYCKKESLQHNESSAEQYKGGRSFAVLVGESLQRWIDSSFDPRQQDTDSLPLPYTTITVDDQYSIMKHCAARMAYRFSSGSYKILVHQDELIPWSMDEEFRALLPHLPTVRDRHDYVRKLKDTESPTDYLAEEEVEEGEDVRSGIARVQGWSRKRSAMVLKRLALEALRHLEVRNVLRSSSGTWELVHDGFAKPFIDWADTQRMTMEDALASLSVLNGQEILLKERTKAPSEIRSANWHGGYIISEVPWVTALKGRHFIDCDFRGVIFVKCDLDESTFTNCTLDGAIFRNCRMNGITFEGGQMRGALFRDGVIGNARFQSTKLLQVGFVDVELAGQVTFSATEASSRMRIESTRFVGIRCPKGGKFVFEGCDLRFCSWEQRLDGLMDIHQDNCKTLNCGAMPETEVKKIDAI